MPRPIYLSDTRKGVSKFRYKDNQILTLDNEINEKALIYLNKNKIITFPIDSFLEKVNGRNPSNPQLLPNLGGIEIITSLSEEEQAMLREYYPQKGAELNNLFFDFLAVKAIQAASLYAKQGGARHYTNQQGTMNCLFVKSSYNLVNSALKQSPEKKSEIFYFMK